MPAYLKPLENPALRSQVAAKLRDAIFSGDLKPGDPVPEASIASQLGISRAPVREAILMLEKDGFLQVIPNRGAFVRRVTPSELAEILSLRKTLEAMALRLAKERISQQELGRLRSLYDGMLLAARSQDVPGYTSNDREFHLVFWEASGHKQLAEVLARITGPVFAFAEMVLTRAKFDVTRLVELHEPLIDYLAGTSPLTLEQIMDPLFSYAFTDEWPILFGEEHHSLG